jgi:hypothetical protein
MIGKEGTHLLRATEVSDGRDRGISCGGRFSQKAVLGLPQLTGQTRKSMPQLGTRLTGPVPVAGKSFSACQKFFATLSQFLR